MSKMKCFLCGARYNPEKRSAVTFLDIPEQEMRPLTRIASGGDTLKLCPACTKAAALGVYLSQIGNENAFNWTEDIEFEENE